VEAAVAYAEAGSPEPLEDLCRDVYTPEAEPTTNPEGAP